MAKKPTDEEYAGCALVLWQLIVVTPMWLMLQFGILTAIGDSAPTWVWVIFFAYAPAVFIGVLISGFKQITKGPKDDTSK